MALREEIEEALYLFRERINPSPPNISDGWKQMPTLEQTTDQLLTLFEKYKNLTKTKKELK